jgi:hypothetical protein
MPANQTFDKSELRLIPKATHSALMFASLMMGHHFSISAF